MRIEGYVILSADGMLADASGVMPAALKFDADQRFFESALDDADLIVHGKNSLEDQP
ncbi:MAG TPA: dihydrofolate reductase, partial [Afipia sp.]